MMPPVDPLGFWSDTSIALSTFASLKTRVNTDTSRAGADHARIAFILWHAIRLIGGIRSRTAWRRRPPFAHGLAGLRRFWRLAPYLDPASLNQGAIGSKLSAILFMVRVPAWELAARPGKCEPLELPTKSQGFDSAFRSRLRQIIRTASCSDGQLSLTNHRGPRPRVSRHLLGFASCRTGSRVRRPSALSSARPYPSKGTSNPYVRSGDEGSRITTNSSVSAFHRALWN